MTMLVLSLFLLSGDVSSAPVELADVVQNADVRHAVGSSAICFFRELRAKTLAEIKKQKKYAAIGGVFDKRAMMFLQNVVRRSDEGEERARELTGKRKPTACGDKQTAHASRCYMVAFRGDALEDDEVCRDFGLKLTVAHHLVEQLAPIED